MYRMTEEQLNNMIYIINHLTVTGPEQGGLLNLAGNTLDSVRKQKVETIRPKERRGDHGDKKL